jgi:uncharacterized protein YbbK (DUF523 family)
VAECGAKLGRVAVSECLLGSPVRWDGDHNGDAWPRQRAERLFDLVGLCPEVGIGMGAPRKPIELVGDPRGPWRAVAVAEPAKDYTDRLQGYAERMAATLDGVAGYIFADRSPSCGLAGVKVFSEAGSVRRIGRGVYASAVLNAHPSLPAVDAETLADEDALLAFALAVVRFRRRDVDAACVRDRVGRLVQ